MSYAAPSRNPAHRIVLVYVLAAAAWILFSDRAVALLAPDLTWATRLSILKGWAFVAVTATLLFHFIRRSFQTELASRGGLAASEARFSLAFRSSPTPLSIRREPDGLFVDANESFCRLLGISRSNLLGHTAGGLRIYADASDRPRLLAMLQDQGSVRDQEVQLRTGSGQTLDVLVSIERIELEGEACTLTAFHDMTEQKRLEAERRQLQAEIQHIHKLESLGTLAGGVAHDMNNILGAVMGVASLVQAAHPDEPGLTRDMDTLLRAAARGRDLVKGLTDFARKGVQEPRPVDVNELLTREADLLRRTTRQKIEIQLDLAANLPRILGDAGSLSNALMNLCVNAVDAMPDGGRLRLSSRVASPSEIEVTVADTGIGMPSDVMQRAMDPFFTTKPQGMGTGLGLSLAYSIVKAHQGRMDLHSQEGLGTEVRLRFQAMAGGSLPVPDATPDSQAGLPSQRILVVDDDELIRATVAPMLESLGHVVSLAASGGEVLALLEKTPFSLVILDLNMPGLDGLEVLERLRPRWPRLPVLFATGLKDARLDRILQQAPATGFIAKPFSMLELRTKVATMLAP